jgi:hypothetical protein
VNIYNEINYIYALCMRLISVCIYIYITRVSFLIICYLLQILSWIQNKLNCRSGSKKSSLISATGEFFFDVLIEYVDTYLYHQLKYFHFRRLLNIDAES